MTAPTRDLAAEVTALRGEVDQLRDEQARAEARVAAAEEEQVRLLDKLQKEFRVTTLEAARELLGTLDEEIATEIDRVRTQLDKTGSTS